MDTGIITILVIVIIILAVFSLSLMLRMAHVKARLLEFSEILNDIAAGNCSHKILTRPDEITAELCYQINEIIRHYQDSLIELEKAADANRQLMTSLSHDVRTPLTTLIGYLDAVHSGLAAGRERDDYIETARKKAYNMKEYIDVLFDWFKLNSNEEPFLMENHEIGELTRNILKDWIPIFEEHGLKYDIDIPQSRLMAVVDVDAYQRVINNLVQNVIAHSKAGRIGFNISCGLNQIKVCVSDNGIGIPPEDVSHIFERLYKCDKGRSLNGSGLGLNIVWQLIERMGGSIFVDSRPGEGAAFTVSLPSADEKQG